MADTAQPTPAPSGSGTVAQTTLLTAGTALVGFGTSQIASGVVIQEELGLASFVLGAALFVVREFLKA